MIRVVFGHEKNWKGCSVTWHDRSTPCLVPITAWQVSRATLKGEGRYRVSFAMKAVKGSFWSATKRHDRSCFLEQRSVWYRKRCTTPTYLLPLHDVDLTGKIDSWYVSCSSCGRVGPVKPAWPVK